MSSPHVQAGSRTWLSSARGTFILGAFALACSSSEEASPITSGGAGGTTSSAGTSSGGTTGIAGSLGSATGGKAGSSGAAGGTTTTGGQGTGGSLGGSGGGAGGTTTTGGQGTGGAVAGNGGAPVGGSGGSGGVGVGGGGGSGGASGSSKSAGCGTERTLTNGRKTISSGGMNREFILRVPDNYDKDKPYRLIFAFHWRSGNAQQVAEGGNGGSTEDPFYGLWELAQGSTIFVAPEGLDAGWANTGDRDINLTDAILKQVSDGLCIDTTRIFSTGFSFGAGMSYALACARPDVFRGVALYAGAQLSGCNGGTKPVAYFHAHGVADSVLNISQGRQIRDRFVTNNGCMSQSPPEPARNSGTHTCTSYQGCTAGYPLRWCAHGGDHNPTEKDSGQNKSWVPGEAWTFISQF